MYWMMKLVYDNEFTINHTSISHVVNTITIVNELQYYKWHWLLLQIILNFLIKLVSANKEELG